MIYDFHEILGRGIIAARSGRRVEATKYLNIAASLDPSNVRVWLWLAAAEENPSNKRRFLRQALKVDPDCLVASVLLDRIDQKEFSISQPSTDVTIFTCPFCGGKQYFDPDILGLKCLYCHKVEHLALGNASDSESDLRKALWNKPENWAVLDGEAACDACGARTSLPPAGVTVRCPFCDSDLITIRPPTPGLVTPTAIAPFRRHREDVVNIVGSAWKIPPARLERMFAAREATICPIYLPFWTFDGRVQIRCALEYPVWPVEYSSSERVIQKGDWDVKSWFECEIDDLPIYAARSVTDEAIAQLPPFDFKDVLEYRPEVLAGWQAEYYQISLQDAAIVARKHMYDAAFRRAAAHGLFMDASRMLSNDIQAINGTYRLILAPIWIVRRADAGRVVQALVNGQNGGISRKKNKWLDIFRF